MCASGCSFPWSISGQAELLELSLAAATRSKGVLAASPVALLLVGGVRRKRFLSELVFLLIRDARIRAPFGVVGRGTVFPGCC